MGEQVVSKSEFARLIGVNPSQVTGYLDRNKIGPEALVGEGRTARIRVEVAKAHLRVRLDAAQRLGNGLGTRLAPAKPDVPAEAAPEPAAEPPDVVAPSTGGRPAPPPIADSPDADDVGDDALDAALKREKLAALQRANRREADEEAAAQGRYTETASARRQMTMIGAQVLRTFEGAIPEIATALAARFTLDEREVTLALNELFRTVREDASKKAREAAEKLDPLAPGAPED